MKKYVSLIICLVILVIAIVIGEFETSDVVCGRGNGQDSKVNTIEQFSDILGFLKENKKTLQSEKNAKNHQLLR